MEISYKMTLDIMKSRAYANVQINGLMQKRCNSSALAMELRLFCIEPSKHCIANNVNCILHYIKSIVEMSWWLDHLIWHKLYVSFFYSNKLMVCILQFRKILFLNWSGCKMSYLALENLSESHLFKRTTGS